MIEIPFATFEGQSVVEQNSRESLLNMFAEIEISGRKKLIRRQRAGVLLNFTIAGEKRCIERHKENHYAIIGNRLYRYNGVTLTSLGTLSSSVGRCTMIFNDNDQIMVSDGQTGYFWNGSTLSLVDVPFGIGALAYQGGFGLFNVPGTGQFATTHINDFSTVDALDFATAESYPDNLVRAFVDHNEVWLFGQRSTEIWQLSGGVDFPFSRYTNAQLERGCAAPFSVAADDNTVFWLGDDKVIYRAEGYRPQRVSNHPIEKAIADLSDVAVANADAFVYTLAGNKFYTLRFPGELTLQYNIATGFWNRARTFGFGDWRLLGSAGHYADYFMSDGGIVSLQDDLSTDEGGIMERGGISAPIAAEGARLTMRSFWLDAEMGRADINQNANVMLRVARDGETFGNERWRSLGRTGQYTRRAMWRGIGQGRRIALELMMTDPTPFHIVSTNADVITGR